MHSSYLHPLHTPVRPLPCDLLQTMEPLMSRKGQSLYRDPCTGYVYGFLSGHLVCRSHIVAAIGLSMAKAVRIAKCYASIDAPHVCERAPSRKELRFLRVNAAFVSFSAQVSDTQVLYTLFCHAVKMNGGFKTGDQSIFDHILDDGLRAAATGRSFPGRPKTGPGHYARLEEKELDLDDASSDRSVEVRHVVLRQETSCLIELF